MTNQGRLQKILFWSISVCISVLIFLIPSNLFLKCCESTGYVNGLFIDYLLPKLYLSDILIWVILVIGSMWLFIAKKKKARFDLRSIFNDLSTHRVLVTTLLFMLVLGVRQVTTSHPVAAFWYFAKLMEMALVSLFLSYFFRSLNRSSVLQANKPSTRHAELTSVARHAEQTPPWRGHPKLVSGSSNSGSLQSPGRCRNKFGMTDSKKVWRLLSLSLAITICFQSLLAIYQYTQQHELLGFHFLGEPQLTQPLSLARITLSSGITQVLPYSTTAHPNVLAGVIAIYLLLWFLIQQKYSMFKPKTFDWLSLILLALGCSALYLTHSISAWSTLCIGVVILSVIQSQGKTTSKLRLMLSSKSAAILLLLISFCFIPLAISVLAENNPTDTSLTRRSDLQHAALQMVLDRPLFGVGLNNFTAEVENYSESNGLVRFVQPVHHVGWLWLSETGLLGLSIIGLIIALFLKSGQNKRGKLAQLTVLFLILLPIFSLDHYLLTVQTGLLLSVLCLVVFLIPDSNSP